MEDDLILRGKTMESLPNCSLGDYLLPKIRSHPPNHILQVNSLTGETQTSLEHLSVSIQVSEGFKKLGLKENDVIAMLCRNSFEAFDVVLGTWLMGGTISPLDVDMKILELKHVFGIVKPKCVFCEEEVVSKVSSALDALSMTPLIVVKTRSKGSLHSHPSFEEVLVDVDVDNYKPSPISSPSTQMVITLPSSGTSGFSKEIGITHTNLIFQDLNWSAVHFFDKSPSCLQISHLFWVTGVLAYLKSLSSGMKRTFIPEVTNVNILKAIEKYKPEWFLLTPLALVSLSICPEFDQFDVSSVKSILIGGDKFAPTMASKIKGRWSHTTILQAYGTTESSGTLTFAEKGDDIFSVGKACPGVQLKVVDITTGKRLKANSVGEICFLSPGMMKGYVGNEKATKEFKDSEGWGRTGDLAYYDESGQFYIVDRIKEMIKVGGWQIAPAEIESVIYTIPGVSEAAVIGVTPDGVTNRLTAFVVKSKKDITEEDVASHVENNLSHYKKLTGGVHFVESLPKTASGKLQRGELKKLAQSLCTKS